VSTRDVDTVVIGAGAMGSAAARSLAARGRDVLLLERFQPGHENGASHGESRNFNQAYNDPEYLALLVEALPAWRQLEAETGIPLLDQVGMVNHGDNPGFDTVLAALQQVGIAAEFLGLQEASERWPGIRFDTRVLYTPDSGRLNANRAVAALQQAAAADGATVRHGARVRSLRVIDDTHVVVETDNDDGSSETITARTAVVTVGAWTAKLLGDTVVLPGLTVTQEQPAHFRVLDDATPWPGFNHSPGADSRYDYWPSGIYGMFTPGQGVKAGWHGVGPVTDPDARTFTAEPTQLAQLQQYARDWLPGVDADDLAPISCTYTTTRDSNFLLDRLGPLVIGAGFSGHGFKFTPAIGRVLADLADGTGRGAPQFSLAAAR
jgi:sarcosine oxidase